ncbi:ABC transporter ATP-binding protein [Candidatus Epulonipiscium fishelsonii]|uniref:ABC transporter ATP-binding protein n=1 Tax=Candidatus Epulonipiscium fishelsonii TaxID=77094 RepID=A0ACC8X7L5_9FIRM|nr:ABC transporter ATP-binding protein [Epulopiscium sp. SCG-B11WGA-EpuloA1]ONI40702.1 ABC transporter ATP-binding protein [Epulopiscium sp. SCG-B05WGA-EpuloA1]
MLEVEKISVNFGGIKPVDQFDLSLQKGELVGLIGPNGAGKTTVFNLLTGVYTPTEGKITLEGKLISNLKPFQIAKKGITRTFQNIRLFKSMTVIENVKVAFDNRINYSILDRLFNNKKYKDQEQWLHEEAMKILDIFDLGEYAEEQSMNLPYGKQRKLEIARALAGDPKILLLDEPAAGMNPQETLELRETIKLIRKQFDITILLIEHDMNFVMDICERLVVIEYGKIIAKGTPNEIKHNERVINAYLGQGA